jgi:hypothetical protein
MSIEQLKDVIKRAKSQFCSDGSDGEVASRMFNTLCEVTDVSELTDTDRIDFLKHHTNCDFWVHHKVYKHQGKPFSCEGVVIREVIDSAIKWHLKNVNL